MEGLRIADEASRTSHETGGAAGKISEEVKEDFFIHFDQGFQFLRENKYNKARKEWERALEIQPDNEMVKFNLKKLAEREEKAKQKTD